MTLLSPSELLAFDGFLQGFTGAGSSSVPRPSGVHGGGAGSSSLKQHAGSVSVSANGANQLNNGNADRDSALFGPGQHHQEAPLGAHRSHLSEREQAPHGLVSVSFPAAQYRPRQSYRPHSSSSAASNASSNFSPVPPFRAAHAHQEQERRMKAQASELAGWMNWHEQLRAGLPSPPKEAPPPLPASGASRSSNGPPNGSTHVNGNGRVPQPHLSPLDTSLAHSLPLPLDPALEQLTFSRTVFPPPQPPAASPSNDIGSSRATKKIGGKGRARGLDAVASHAALESAEPPAKKQKTAVKPGAKRAGMRTKEQVEQSSFAPGTPSQQIPPETVDDLPPHMQPMPSRVSQPTTNGHSDAGAGAVDTFNQPQASTSATPAPGVNGFDRQFPANDESADLAPSAKKRSTTSNGTAASGASKPTVNAAAGRRRSSASTSASVTKRPSPPINQAPASGTQSSGQAGALGGASASAVSRDMASVPSTIPPIPPEAPDFAHGGSSVSDAPPAPSPAASQPPLPKVVLTEEQKRANHIASEQKRRTAIRSAYDELCGVVPSLRAAVQEYEERLTRVHGAQAAAAAASRRGSAGRSDGTQGTGGTEIETVAGVLTGGIDVGGEKVDGRAGPKSEAVVLGKTVEYLRDLLEEREELLARYTELVGRTAYDAGNDLQAVWNAKWSKKLT